MSIMNRTYVCLVILLLCCWGCGDMPPSVLEQILPDSEDTAEPPDSDRIRSLHTGTNLIGGPAAHADITRVPAHLQDLWWGSWDDTLDAFQESFANAETDAEHFHDATARNRHLAGLFRQACLRAARTYYFDKYISADGIAIIGSNDVDDNFFLMYRDIVLALTAKHPNFRKALSGENNVYFLVVNRLTDDFFRSTPEFQWQASDGWYPIGYCGIGDFGGTCAFPVDPNNPRSIRVFVHEFAHAVEGALLSDPHLFPTINFSQRFTEVWEEAKQWPRYKNDPNSYLFADEGGEYWAVSSDHWFRDLNSLGIHENPILNVFSDEASNRWLAETEPTPHERLQETIEVWREHRSKLVSLLQDVYPMVNLSLIVDKYFPREEE